MRYFWAVAFLIACGMAFTNGVLGDTADSHYYIILSGIILILFNQEDSKD